MKILLIVIVIAVVAVVGYLLLKSNTSTVIPPVTESVSSTPEQSSPAESSSTQPSTNPSVSPSTASQVKSFTVSGANFSFSPTTIKVKRGDTVKITFNNKEGIHDWVQDEFSVRTPRIQSGQSATVTFVASKTGTFEYYCSVGEHRAKGMKGNLIVE